MALKVLAGYTTLMTWQWVSGGMFTVFFYFFFNGSKYDKGVPRENV